MVPPKKHADHPRKRRSRWCGWDDYQGHHHRRAPLSTISLFVTAVEKATYSELRTELKIILQTLVRRDKSITATKKDKLEYGMVKRCEILLWVLLAKPRSSVVFDRRKFKGIFKKKKESKVFCEAPGDNCWSCRQDIHFHYSNWLRSYFCLHSSHEWFLRVGGRILR